MRNLIATILTLLSFSLFAQDPIPFSPASDGTTFLTCNGFVIDSGGQGGSGYSDNENTTITICPDTITTGDNSLYITVTFNLFLLDGTNTGTQQNPNVDRMTVYDGTSTSANTLGTYSTNGLQNVSIAATNLNPTGCLTFVFYSNSTGTGQFTASATCTTPCVPPVASAFIVGGVQPDSILVCVGAPVSFDGSASTAATGFNIDLYEWNFIDGTLDTTSGSTVTHSFAAPGQYQVQLTLTDDNADNVCHNMNVVPLKVYVGNYPTWYDFPQDTTLCLGESISLSGLNLNGDYDSTWTGFPTSNTVDDGCLPDTLLGISQSIPIVYTEFDPSVTVTQLSDIQDICINMEHSYMGDLVIQLTCPNGTTINLQTQGGGGTNIGVPDQADNVDCPNGTGIGTGWDYCWNASAAETWTDYVTNNGFPGTLPSGSYASVDPLSNLIGCPLNGQWQITVIDNWAADDGTIFEFGVTFDPSFYGNIVQFTTYVGMGADSSYWDMTDPWITANSADLNDITVFPGAPGVFVYDYTVMNDFGCMHDSSVTITVTDNPLADAGPDTSICGGGINSIQLEGGIGGGGPATCDYTLDLIDTFGDTWNGNTIDVTIDGVTTNYTESNGSLTTILLAVAHGDQITLQWNATGNWQSENEIYLYDSNGDLVYSDGTNFSTPSTAPATFTADCFGGMIFSWTPDNGTLDDVTIPNPISTPTGTQEYVLTVYPTGHPLCWTTDTVIVDMGGASDAGTDGSAFFCQTSPSADLFTFLGGTPQVTGIWIQVTTGDTIPMPYDPAVLPPGDYEYHVDSIGCTSFSTVSIQVDTPSTSNVATDSDCSACNGQVTLTGATGQGFYEYSMDNGVTFQLGDTFTNLCPGDHFFVVRDSLGCMINDTATVVEINVPTISFNDTTSTDCGASIGDISVNTNSGTAPFQFGIVGGVLQADSTISGLPVGTYDIMLMDNFGCTDTLFNISIDSINNPVITLVTTVDVDCNSANNGTVDIQGNNITQYSMDGGATLQPNGMFTGIAPGTYSVFISNDFGCTDTASFTITEPTPLQLQITSTIDSICLGESATLSVVGTGGNGGPYTFEWSQGATILGQGTPFDVTPTASLLTYCVLISEVCGSPTDTACTTVYVEPAVFPTLVADILVGCPPLEVTFTNTSVGAIASSQWYFGNGDEQGVSGTSSVINIYDYTGLFSVTLEVTTPEGCVYDTTYTDYIETYEYPNANFTFNPNPVSMYEPEVTFQDLSSGNIVSWLWSFPGATPTQSSIQHPVINYPEGQPGVYDVYLTVINSDGCIDSTSVQIKVVNEVIIYAPNAFTPDGDEFNETWRVFIDGIDVYSFSLVLFNRWGGQVWESHNIDVGWDGRFQGKLVQDGTYVWIIQCKDQWTDKKYTFNGHVTIIK